MKQIQNEILSSNVKYLNLNVENNNQIHGNGESAEITNGDDAEATERLNQIVTTSDPDVNNVHDSSAWVFGYGSLIWKVDFEFEYCLTGYIKGYERRFYQHSIDHRGTPEKPGRVVTLIPSTTSESRVWGMAYKLAESHRLATLKHLDFREKNGYERHLVEFHPYPNQPDQAQMNLLVYVADKENESFAGPNELNVIAKQIYSAVGPSGTNREYVYMLADAMRKHFPGQVDEHLFGLEALLKKRENEMDSA